MRNQRWISMRSYVLAFAVVLSPAFLQTNPCVPTEGNARLASLELEVAGVNQIVDFAPDKTLYTVAFASDTAILRVQSQDPAATIRYQWWIGSTKIEVWPLGVGSGEVTFDDMPEGQSTLRIRVKASAETGGAVLFTNIEIHRSPAGSYPSTEQGILDAINAGGGPHFFEPGTATTTAEIVIYQDVILDGGGLTTVDGGGAHRVFSVEPGVTATIRGFTITGGGSGGAAAAASGFATKAAPGDMGNAIYNEGTLTVDDTMINDNLGGAIINTATGNLTVTNSTIVRNTGAINWGGIMNSGVLAVSDSTISDNEGDQGGGFYTSSGVTSITHSTVSGNAAVDGGGMYVTGTASLTVTNTTVSGNSASNQGGGVWGGGSATITVVHSTLFGNSATEGSTGYGTDTVAVTYRSNLIEGICAAGSGTGTVTSLGYNVQSPDASCIFPPHPTDVLGVPDLGLGELQDNGGLTLTHAPVQGSIALDLILPAACLDHEDAPVTEDQRRFVRPEAEGTDCDAGAVEGYCNDCDDSNDCTAGACDPGTRACSHTPVPDGEPCDSGAGKCIAGMCDHCEGMICDDGNQCTADVCDPATGDCPYAPMPIDTACDQNGGRFCDGLGNCVGCNIVDQCGSGICTAPVCQNNQCGQIPDREGLGCNRIGTCQDGVCVPFPCTEEALRQAVALGGWHTFSCDQPIMTTSEIAIDNTNPDTWFFMLEGSGQGLTVQGAGDHPVFRMEYWEGCEPFGPPDARFRDVTITGGNPGIVNDSCYLDLVRVEVTGNPGRGIENNGFLELRESTVSGNSAGYGAGIHNLGLLHMWDSTISGNNAYSSVGGGIFNGNDMDIENSTISGNTAELDGAAIYNGQYGEADVTYSTIVRNTVATPGGGDIYHDDPSGFEYLRITKSLIDGNCSLPSLTSGGYNIESPGDTCGLGGDATNSVNVDPRMVRLSNLQNNGGLTDTHQPLLPAVDNLAIDYIPASECGGYPADQRDVSRPQPAGGSCDVGSVEVNWVNPCGGVVCGPDGNVCTVDVCDPATGACYPPVPDGTLCDAGNDECWGGICSLCSAAACDVDYSGNPNPECPCTWSVLVPSNSPGVAGSGNHILTYSGGRRCVLAYNERESGLDPNSSSSVYDAAANEYDVASSWVYTPSVQSRQAAAYIAHDKVLVFGGYKTHTPPGYSHMSDDTWLFDLTEESLDVRWKLLNPPNRPLGRILSAMAYLGDNKVLMFGGTSRSGYGFTETYYDDTWIFDLSDGPEGNWTEYTGSPHPSARCDHAMARVGEGKVVLFGGSDVNANWGNSYSDRQPSDSHWHEWEDIGVPDHRDTWVFDLNDGAGGSWTEMSPPRTPWARTHHSMAYLGADKVVMYGGFGSDWHWEPGYDDPWVNHPWRDGPWLDDTWIYDLSENDWALVLSLTQNPGARRWHKMCETSLTGSEGVFLFGGEAYPYGDTVSATWMFGAP